MAMKIRKGDTVMVIAGDDKGKTGRVLSVNLEKQRVVIEKVNMVKRHRRARSANQQGGVIEMEAGVHLSNVLLYDPKAGKGVRVGVRTAKDGTRERFSRSSGDTISKKD
jgi:large subunit ribosomal protein L24